MVGPAVLTFVKELGEFYGSNRPQLFGFIDSLEAVDINSPGLEFLDGSHFWEGSPRYAQADDTDAQKAYRAAVGIDDNGASVGDPKDVSTAAHMFGCWETLYVIKKAMEDAGYKGPEDRAKLVEATEALDRVRRRPRASCEGTKTFNGKIHQCFGIQNISKVEGGKLKVVHQTTIEDGLSRAGRRLHDAAAVRVPVWQGTDDVYVVITFFGTVDGRKAKNRTESEPALRDASWLTRVQVDRPACSRSREYSLPREVRDARHSAT